MAQKKKSKAYYASETSRFLDTLIGELYFKPKTENQKKLIKSIKDNDVTVCIGEAGCGKTFLACYQALELLRTEPKFNKILLIKSMTELKGESIGTLPGGKDEKVMASMMSFMDSFYKLIGKEKIENLIEEGYIVFEPIAFCRGRDFSNSIVLIDETQNITHDNLKTILTRLSENSKYIIIGDTEQIDLKQKSDSSLKFIFDKVTQHPVEGVGIVQFTSEDIVRHRLTSYFLGLFKN